MKRFVGCTIFSLMVLIGTLCTPSTPWLVSLLAPVAAGGCLLFFCIPVRQFSSRHRKLALFSLLFWTLALTSFDISAIWLTTAIWVVLALLMTGDVRGGSTILITAGLVSLYYGLCAGIAALANSASPPATLYSSFASQSVYAIFIVIFSAYGLLQMLAMGAGAARFSQQRFRRFSVVAYTFLLCFHTLFMLASLLYTAQPYTGGPALVPLSQIIPLFAAGFWPAVGAMLGVMAIALPYGFFVNAVRSGNIAKKRFFMALLLAVFVEGTQWLLGTGVPALDDLVLIFLGFYAGGGLYTLCSVVCRLLSRGRVYNVYALVPQRPAHQRKRAAKQPARPTQRQPVRQPERQPQRPPAAARRSAVAPGNITPLPTPTSDMFGLNTKRTSSGR